MSDMQRSKTITIGNSIDRLYRARQKKRQFEERYNAINKQEQLAISNFIFSNFPAGTDGFTYEYNDSGVLRNLSIKRQRRAVITWDIEKVKKRVSKSVFKKIAKQTYTINDIEGLIEYLKTCRVDPKRFKQYIDKTEEIDTKALDDAYELGMLERNDIKGCYKIEYGEPYIRMREIKDDP